jgi:hypothetical protein
VQLLDKLQALSLKGKAVAGAAVLASGYLVRRGLGVFGKSKPKTSAPAASSGPLSVPAANQPSVRDPLTGKLTTAGAVTTPAAANDPLAAVAVALASFITASGAKDPAVMRSVAQYQTMVGLLSDGRYGKLTRADLQKHLSVAAPAAASWS